jgi:hypothetical protein
MRARALQVSDTFGDTPRSSFPNTKATGRSRGTPRTGAASFPGPAAAVRWVGLQRLQAAGRVGGAVQAEVLQPASGRASGGA